MRCATRLGVIGQTRSMSRQPVRSRTTLTDISSRSWEHPADRGAHGGAVPRRIHVITVAADEVGQQRADVGVVVDDENMLRFGHAGIIGTEVARSVTNCCRGALCNLLLPFDVQPSFADRSPALWCDPQSVNG